MFCLCCGKKIDQTNSVDGWHKTCIKKFFGTNDFPQISLGDADEEYEKLAEGLIGSNKSVTGVQKKLSLHLSKEDGTYRLTLIGYPQGYILKPNSKEYVCIAEAEHLVMNMASLFNIQTPLQGLINIKKEINQYAYITKRLDRENNNKIHMEDFCQLSNKPTEYKYNGSYEKCAKIIDTYSLYPLADKTELFNRILFCYITGNSDMHLKNFSLIETNGGYILSKQYDLLPVKILINDEEDLALTLNGKKKNITRNDFVKFGENIGMNNNAIRKLIDYGISKEEKMIEMVKESFLNDEYKMKFINLLTDRITRLKNII